MSFLQKMRAVWQKISLVQRALLVAIIVTFGLVSALLVHWACRPDMRMLYQELAPEEAAEVVEKIGEQGIVYELRNGGTSIYVPKEKVYQLRLDLAKDGLPAGEQGGYKIFENEKIGVSPFVQSVNLKRALQEEHSDDRRRGSRAGPHRTVRTNALHV
jgi:flagellar M-ring protein FliF